MRNITIRFLHVFVAVSMCLLILAGPVRAQIYTRLQVLLPGEIEAPDTPLGKAGTPSDQAAEIGSAHV